MSTDRAEIEERSAGFKKELGLFDLVLTQIVFVVGTFWVVWAARIGHEQSIFWILAILTFYLPLAAAVIFLNRLMPLEGGLYQWSKLAFNDFVGFIARLPMVAGWDRLLPAWFSRLHPKYKTPINSILFVGAVTLVLGFFSLMGVHAQGGVSIVGQRRRGFLRADLPGAVCDSAVWDESSWRQGAMVAQDRVRVRLRCYSNLYTFLHRSILTCKVRCHLL